MLEWYVEGRKLFRWAGVPEGDVAPQWKAPYTTIAISPLHYLNLSSIRLSLFLATFSVILPSTHLVFQSIGYSSSLVFRLATP